MQFLCGLSPENKLEVKCIGTNKPLTELVRTLEDLERDKAEMMLGVQPAYQAPSTYQASVAQPTQTFTSADIDRIVNEKIQAMQRSYIQPAPAIQ